MQTQNNLAVNVCFEQNALSSKYYQFFLSSVIVIVLCVIFVGHYKINVKQLHPDYYFIEQLLIDDLYISCQQ